MDLEMLRDILSDEEFQEYERLLYMGEEPYTPQWYTTQEMIQEILSKYNLGNPSDPYGMG